MHISSLPSRYGIGDFGQEAYKFVDFLEKTGQKNWQILPLGPTGYGDSPYQSYSSYAGNYLFIDLEELVSLGELTENDIRELATLPQDKVDYERVSYLKRKALLKAYKSFSLRLQKNENLENSYKKFLEENKNWLRDYSLYMTFREKFEYKPWQQWKKEYKNRDFKKINLEEWELEKIEFYNYTQYIFFTQWYRLKKYANEKNIKIIGDIPIYVSSDSADTWSNPNIFQYTKSKTPKRVAGCPPDYFSKTGQLWGNILYDWKKLKEENYTWWINRIEQSFKMYDILRIDHFRGFEAYWSIKYGEKTAIRGRWEKGPKMELFRAIEKKLGKLPIIAEDLGLLTDGVRKLLKRSGYPGMKVLEFAFDGSLENEYLPHNYIENCVAYSGTHDNDTAVGWYEKLDLKTKKYCDEYLKKWLLELGSNFWEPINWRFIEVLWSSKSKLTIVQMQDILGLGEFARMNKPSTLGNNWNWRLNQDYSSREIIEKLKNLNIKYNR